MTKESPAFTEGTRPSDPTSAAAASEMMSPYMLGATATSNTLRSHQRSVRSEEDVNVLWFAEHPIDHAIDKLFVDLDGVVAAVDSGKCGDTTNSFTEETVRHG